MSRIVVVSMLVLGLAACATAKRAAGGGPEIKDEWIARVPESEQGPIRDARDEVRSAQDEETRHKVAVNDARRELDVQKSMRDASKARVDAAQKQVDAAKATGDQRQLEQAQGGLDAARSADAVAKARIEVHQARLQMAEARHELAQARLTTAKAKQERAEYQVLRDRNDTRISAMSPAEFDREIEKSQLRERELETKFRDSERLVTDAEQRLQQKQQQGVGGTGEQDSK